MSIVIRQESIEDIDEVFYVVRKAFEKADYSDHDEHHLVNRLRKSDMFIPALSLVAVDEDRIVGYILFTEIKVRDHILVALAPVAVLPDVQKKSIGKLLIMEGHQLASRLGYKGSIVMGHEQYYPKFGYQKASQYQIKAPFEVPDECYMAIELTEGGLSGVHGVVEYAKEFFSSRSQ